MSMPLLIFIDLILKWVVAGKATACQAKRCRCSSCSRTIHYCHCWRCLFGPSPWPPSALCGCLTSHASRREAFFPLQLVENVEGISPLLHVYMYRLLYKQHLI